MTDPVPPLWSIAESDPANLLPLAREARGIAANAVLLARPTQFVPGTEALRLEATVRQLLDNRIARLDSALGPLTLRAEGAGAAIGAPRLQVGQLLLLTLAPSGATARIELLPQPLPGLLATRVAPPSAVQAIAAAAAATPPTAGLVDNARAETPPQGIRALASFAPSLLGAERQGPLWLQSGLYDASDRRGAAAPSGEAARAFQSAQSLERPNPLQQIAQSFAGGTRPFHEITGLLAGFGQTVLSRGLDATPKPNSAFGIALLLYLLTLRHGGLRRWLGDLAGREIRLHGADELFDHLEDEVRPRLRNLGRRGYWEVTLVPLLLESLSHLVWATRRLAGDPSPARRDFALQMQLGRSGPLQITGHVLADRLDLTLLAPHPLPAALTDAVAAAMPDIFTRYGLEGRLLLSKDPSGWLPFLDAETVNNLL